MSYWQRWRRNYAATRALAESSSDSEEENNPVEQHEESDANTSQNISYGDMGSGSEDSSSDFGFSDHVQSSDSDNPDSENLLEDHVEAEERTVKEQLATWATSNGCSKTCVDQLLKIMRPVCNVDLPKDCRTLLKTPRSIEYSEKCGGKYIFFGIKTGILKTVSMKSFPLDYEKTLKLNFNIDGVPLFKSSGTQFWPILCSLENYTPFLVAIFYGQSKPNSLDDFLSDFLLELGTVLHEGIQFNEHVLHVKVNAFICDAPARAFLKGIKGHAGYDSCERCTVHGYNPDRQRVILHSDESCPLRTDEDFRERRYPAHQTRVTPLAAHPDIFCVTGFCLDYMHLVCLGVVKRILWFLRQGPPECKISALQVSQLSNLLVSFCGKLPSEFARQPRTVYDLERWKATELRQFLLYTGPVILKKILSKRMYEHFLTLTVGISFLLESDEATRTSYLSYSKELLTYFVKKSKELYTEKFITYNVHSLLHLADDSRHFGCSLNEISGFLYENHLQSIKKLVKNAKNPIVQVAKRVQEKEAADVMSIKQQPTFKVITTKERNSCFLLKDGSFAFVKEKRDNSKTLVCQILRQDQTENFFTSPCDSKLLNIVFYNRHQRMKRKNIHVQELYKKLVLLHVEHGFVLIPMLHTLD